VSVGEVAAKSVVCAPCSGVFAPQTLSARRAAATSAAGAASVPAGPATVE
jgi:hypothetical protein